MLGEGRNGEDWIILALTHTRLGNQEKARAAYEKAITWIKEHRPHDADLQRFVTEAAEGMTND